MTPPPPVRCGAYLALVGAPTLAVVWYTAATFDTWARQQEALQAAVTYTEPWRTTCFGLATGGVEWLAIRRVRGAIRRQQAPAYLLREMGLLIMGLGAAVLVFTTAVISGTLPLQGASVVSGLIPWQRVGMSSDDGGKCLRGASGTERLLRVEGKLLVVPWLPLPRNESTLESLRRWSCRDAE